MSRAGKAPSSISIIRVLSGKGVATISGGVRGLGVAGGASDRRAEISGAIGGANMNRI